MPHRAVAVALDEVDGRQVITLDDGARLENLDAVVLAQGHLGMEPTPQEAELARFAESAGLRYVPPGNPADADLGGIASGEAVALRGMGLNFFDCVATLTEGRGGRYVRVDGRLIYHPCGGEPVLYAGSRRGVPYHARGENQKGASSRHEPVFLTADVVRGLCARRPVWFRRDVWPLVSQEVRLVYHRTIVAERDGRSRSEAFAREFIDAVVGGQLAEATVLYRYRITQRWNWDRITRPAGDRLFASHEEYRSWLVEYLRRDLAESLRGNVCGPLKAALDVLRDLRNEIRLVVDHGGLTGDSYRRELQDWYDPLNAFVSIGPPARRIEEMAVGARPYHLVDEGGREHPRRYAFGVPTETVHWVTAAGIRPGVNSVILADADAIARSMLALPDRGTAGDMVAARHGNTP